MGRPNAEGQSTSQLGRAVSGVRAEISRIGPAPMKSASSTSTDLFAADSMAFG
jgi:hypothetical protein